MITKTRIVLVAALVFGSASAALAESYDYNPRDRWPDATVAVPAPRTSAPIKAPTRFEWMQFDHASQSLNGGF